MYSLYTAWSNGGIGPRRQGREEKEGNKEEKRAVHEGVAPHKQGLKEKEEKEKKEEKPVHQPIDIKTVAPFIGDEDEDEEESAELRCPLSDELMYDAVSTASGQTYSEREIAKWLQTNNTDPLSHEELPTKKLTPNYAIRRMVDKFIRKSTALKQAADDKNRMLAEDIDREVAKMKAALAERAAPAPADDDNVLTMHCDLLGIISSSFIQNAQEIIPYFLEHAKTIVLSG